MAIYCLIMDHGIFLPNNRSKIPTYKERSAELKIKLDNPIPLKKVKATVLYSRTKITELKKLKSYKNKKFKLKIQQSITKLVPQNKS